VPTCMRSKFTICWPMRAKEARVYANAEGWHKPCPRAVSEKGLIAILVSSKTNTDNPIRLRLWGGFFLR